MTIELENCRRALRNALEDHCSSGTISDLCADYIAAYSDLNEHMEYLDRRRRRAEVKGEQAGDIEREGG